MYLHFPKNNRTFEVLNELEQSHSQFLNQNKAQAIRCKSFNLRYPARLAATWAFVLQLKTQMLNEKNRTLPHHAPQSTPSRTHALQVTKVECPGPDPFAIHVKFNNRGTTVIRFSNPDHFIGILESLAKANQ